jgi:hypothetical protein
VSIPKAVPNIDQSKVDMYVSHWNEEFDKQETYNFLINGISPDHGK